MKKTRHLPRFWQVLGPHNALSRVRRVRTGAGWTWTSRQKTLASGSRRGCHRMRARAPLLRWAVLELTCALVERKCRLNGEATSRYAGQLV